jgi:hypothetical protein
LQDFSLFCTIVLGGENGITCGDPNQGIHQNKNEMSCFRSL